MIITCPECSTQFDARREALGEFGRKVKCAKCAHVWFQAPPPEPEPVPAPDPLPPAPDPDAPMPDFDALLGKIQLPVPVDASRQMGKTLRLWSLILLLAGIGAIGWGFAPQLAAQPSLGWLYGFFGVTPSEGVVLTGLSIETAETSRNTRYLISGFLQNHARVDRKVPSILLTTTDGQQQPIGASELLATNGAVMKPGEKIPFFKELKRYSKDIAYVYIDLGNNYQLSHRQ